MKSIAATTLSLLGVVASLSQRPPPSGCCFQLNSVGDLNAMVEEGQAGDLLLGGSLPEAVFCLNQKTGALKDDRGDTCFVQAPSRQLTCSIGSFGSTHFDITEPDTHGMSYLSYGDDIRRFHACPAPSASVKSYFIYSDNKPDSTGCFEITLNLKDPAAECHLNNTTTAGAASAIIPSTSQPMTGAPPSTSTMSMRTLIPPTTRPVAVSTVEAVESATTTSMPGIPSQTCTIPSSAPSLGPSRVGYPDAKAPGGFHESSPEVSISSDNSTIFEYTIPPSFPPTNANVNGTPPLCALQFRMPDSSELAEGYPYYHYSGMEQEYSGHSGINFELLTGNDATTWDKTALHQVYPGDHPLIGTFDCAKLNVSEGGSHIVSWKATSVNNFFLDFLQAGVGDHPQFPDGVGAFVVPCV